MADIARVRFVWSGTPLVGGGVSTFYTSNLAPATFTTAVRTFLAACGGLFPAGTTITPPSGGELIDENTGALSGVWTMTPGAALSGSGGAGAYAAGVGMRVRWNTAGVTRGRRVRGTTYLLPAMASTYQSDGTIADSNVALVQTAADTLVAADSGSMRIWSRPSTSGGSDGASHAVTSSTVPDAVTWLRSRRT